MQEFNIGDKVVCVCRNYYNWYKIGSEFTIRSGSFVDHGDDTVCYLVEEFSDDGIWIQGNHFNLVKEEPKQMKPTDKITVEITLAELAKIYAVMGKANGDQRCSLYDVAQNKFDPTNKRGMFMEKLSGKGALDYHRYEKEFMKLMFPEPPKKSKEQIKIEELEILLMDTKNKLEELKNISK